MKIQLRLVQSTLVFFAVAFLAGATGSSDAPHQRTFTLTYTAEVRDIPAGAKEVNLWLPYPTDDRYQKILKTSVSAPYRTKIYSDPKYGNRILFLTVKNPKEPSIRVQMQFEVRRLEHVNRDFDRVEGVAKAPADGLERWLGSDRLVPLDRRIQTLAREVTEGKKTDLEKARAIYDYVVSTMRYDKSGTGWGNGDIYWACDTKRGNCTDFHALFIGLARAVGIPVKFEIGFPLPADQTSGEIPGYHCWATFYLKGIGWVPVDASEGWKNPAKRDYFFGAHDANRMQFTVGRDIRLTPAQAGPPLNYFIYPYAEVDGKPFSGVEKKFLFRDLRASATANGQN